MAAPSGGMAVGGERRFKYNSINMMTNQYYEFS